MKAAALITTDRAAEQLGCTARTVNRWALREGLGVLYGRVRLLSTADVRRLRGLIRAGPGNPNWAMQGDSHG